MSWKKSALVWSEILRLFVDTLTADNMYSRCNMHISRKDFKRHYLKNKRFLGIFYCISEIAWNLEHLEKKEEYPSLLISEIMDCERAGYLNV